MTAAPPPIAPFATPDPALELGRLARLQDQLVAAGCDAGIFYDPINIRYATGTSNMSVYSLHNPCRYAFVPASGPVVLFDFKGCAHLSDGHPAVAEVREATSWYHFITGPRTVEFSGRWAAEMSALLGARSPGSRARVAVDRLDPAGYRALAALGIDVADGQEVANLAKVIKTTEELGAIRRAIVACEAGIADMANALEPGLTEQALWSVLHRSNIEAGGEWFETRLLTSGPRTNPWYQECSDRVIANGDLVAFDTDLIGLGGYSVDISRTWLAGDAAPTAEQRRLYAAGYEQVVTNTALLQPGMTFAELSAKAHLPPVGLHSPVNACIVHGIGLCNEYPLVVNRDHFEGGGYDGTIEAGMVLCVESLVAPPGGYEAVKLEEQVLVTDHGPQLLSTYPLDGPLLD